MRHIIMAMVCLAIGVGLGEAVRTGRAGSDVRNQLRATLTAAERLSLESACMLEALKPTPHDDRWAEVHTRANDLNAARQLFDLEFNDLPSTQTRYCHQGGG